MDQTGTTTSAAASTAALAGVRVEFERLTASAGWARSLGELRDDVARAVEIRALAESVYLAAVARLDVAETAVAAGPRRAPYATVTALAGGLVTRRHVDEAVKVVEQVPTEVLDAKDETTGHTGAHAVDTFLTDTARDTTPAQTAGAGRALIGRLTPERDVVPPSDVPWLSALAQQWAKVAPDGVGVDEDDQQSLFPDTRTAAQRRYDALAATLRAGLAAGGSDADGPSLDVTVFVTATVDDLTSDGPTSATVDGLGAITRPTLNRPADPPT